MILKPETKFKNFKRALKNIKSSNIPVSMAPLGILAPKSIYCCGFLRKLTNSMISIFASSHPATSLQKQTQKTL